MSQSTVLNVHLKCFIILFYCILFYCICFFYFASWGFHGSHSCYQSAQWRQQFLYCAIWYWSFVTLQWVKGTTRVLFLFVCYVLVEYFFMMRENHPNKWFLLELFSVFIWDIWLGHRLIDWPAQLWMVKRQHILTLTWFLFNLQYILRFLIFKKLNNWNYNLMIFLLWVLSVKWDQLLLMT